MNCVFCFKEIPEIKIHIRDECPACGRDLHICLNCEFYDANAYRQCRETVREPVKDKDKANYCDFFRADRKGEKKTGLESDILKKLNDLFK
jgi:ssDNA-binding Zn-finger/Zn-ribbon topoisomerase 1